MLDTAETAGSMCRDGVNTGAAGLSAWAWAPCWQSSRALGRLFRSSSSVRHCEFTHCLLHAVAQSTIDMSSASAELVPCCSPLASDSLVMDGVGDPYHDLTGESMGDIICDVGVDDTDDATGDTARKSPAAAQSKASAVPGSLASRSGAVRGCDAS